MKVSYWVCSPWHTSLEQAPPDRLLLEGGTGTLDSITWQRRKSLLSDTSLRDEGREVPPKMTVIISDLCQFRKIKKFSCTWEMSSIEWTRQDPVSPRRQGVLRPGLLTPSPSPCLECWKVKSFTLPVLNVFFSFPRSWARVHVLWPLPLSIGPLIWSKKDMLLVLSLH